MAEVRGLRVVPSPLSGMSSLKVVATLRVRLERRSEQESRRHDHRRNNFSPLTALQSTRALAFPRGLRSPYRRCPKDHTIKRVCRCRRSRNFSLVWTADEREAPVRRNNAIVLGKSGKNLRHRGQTCPEGASHVRTRTDFSRNPVGVSTPACPLPRLARRRRAALRLCRCLIASGGKIALCCPACCPATYEANQGVSISLLTP